MKLLQIIGCVQLIALLFLSWRVVGLEKQLIAEVSEISPVTGLSSSIQPSDRFTVGHQENQQLERIYSELAQIKEQLPGNALGESEAPIDSSTQVQLSSAEQVSSVAQTIDYYISMGEIDPVEMSELQASIVTLDENNRKEMFKKLFRALNDGRLEGLL